MPVVHVKDTCELKPREMTDLPPFKLMIIVFELAFFTNCSFNKYVHKEIEKLKIQKKEY